MNKSVSSPESEISLDLLGILKRRKGFIALGLFLGLGTATLYFFLTPPTYRSQMEILVGQRSGNLNSGSVEGMEQVGAKTDVLSTHIQLFTSRRIVEDAIKSGNLLDLESVKAAQKEGTPPAAFVRSGLGVTKGGSRNLRDAHTLQAAFEGPSAEDSALILRAVFDEYVRYLKKHVEGTSGDAVELLTTLGTENAESIRQAEKDLREFMGQTDLLWDGNAAQNIHKDRLDQIEANLALAGSQRINAVSRLTVIKEFLEQNRQREVTDVEYLALLGSQDIGRINLIRSMTDGDPNTAAFQADAPIRNLNANAEYSKFLELVMKEKKLLEQFADEHPSVVAVRNQMLTLRAFIDNKAAGLQAMEDISNLKPKEMLSVFVRLLDHDIKEAKQREDALRNERQAELKNAKALEAAELKAVALRNELSRQQSLADNTQAAIKGLNFVREYSGFSTDVIGDAVPRHSPVWPLPLIVGAIGALGGAFFGGLMAFAADMADTTFKDPDDVSKALGTPVFGHIPQFPKLRESEKKGLLPMDPTVYTLHRPRSPEAEVFRIVRTSVLCSIKDSNTRILQITSPQPGDGKSTTATNLAVSFAQSGKKILLIDADLRRPRVAELCRIKRIPGLSEVLLGELDPPEAIRETKQEGLSVVPSGRRPSNPSELLGGVEFKDLLHLYSEQFDLVIIDTPPLLAVSDAAIVAESADAVIMALRVVKHGRQMAVRARKILEEHNVSVLGLIVNGFGADRNHYGYRDRPDKNSYAYGSGGKYKSYYIDTEEEPAEETRQEQEAISV